MKQFKCYVNVRSSLCKTQRNEMPVAGESFMYVSKAMSEEHWSDLSFNGRGREIGAMFMENFDASVQKKDLWPQYNDRRSTMKI